MDLISNFPTDIIVLAAWTGDISECAVISFCFVTRVRVCVCVCVCR